MCFSLCVCILCHLLQNLAQEILRRTQQTRSGLIEVENRKTNADKTNASMQRAQDLAKDILNLSQSDLDEIMSADGEIRKIVSCEKDTFLLTLVYSHL